MQIRKLQREDKEHVHTILIETDVFRPDEIDVAMELIDEYLDDPQHEDYEIYSGVGEADEVLGFLCFGPTPLTNSTFDLYWVAVKPTAQRRGIGKRLLEFAEERVRARGGGLLLAETSSQPKYLKTRTFYLHSGYQEVAQIKDYYDLGDDLITYGKYLRQPEGG